MQYRIEVSATINSAHQLSGTTLHGHTYKVTAIVVAMMGKDGYGMQFSALKEVLQVACGAVDHCRLETMIGAPATAERLALFLARACSVALKMPVRIRLAVGDDGVVEMLDDPDHPLLEVDCSPTTEMVV